MLDDQIAHVKKLIAAREKIDEELAQILGQAPKRGRPKGSAKRTEGSGGGPPDDAEA